MLGVETEAATHRGRGPTGGWPRAKSQSVRSSTGEAASATPRAPNHKHNLIQILSYTSTYRRKKNCLPPQNTQNPSIDENKTQREGASGLSSPKPKIAGRRADERRVTLTRLEEDETKWKWGNGRDEPTCHCHKNKYRRRRHERRGIEKKTNRDRTLQKNTRDNIDGHKNGYWKDTKQPGNI